VGSEKLMLYLLGRCNKQSNFFKKHASLRHNFKISSLLKSFLFVIKKAKQGW